MSVFQDAIREAELRARGLQPWPNYFRLRANEMESLFSIYTPASSGRALDIGSGIGFNAYILDRFYDQTTAVDLYTEDFRSHSLGIEKTKHFFDIMPHNNINVLSCKCEVMPFKNDYFDTIFMIYTLEHIKSRIAALKEVRRILRKEGEFFLIVPGFLERVFYPLSFYKYILKKMFFYLNKKNRENNVIDTPISNSTKGRHFFKTLFTTYPHFPLPEPHGEYSNYFSELFKSIPPAWFGLVKKSNFKIKKIFTTMFFPKELLSLFLNEKALDRYIKTLWINNKVNKSVFLSCLGQNLCLILEKEDV